MSDEPTTEQETAQTPQGETEEQYYERVKSAPGIFSDFNETAKDVVERAGRLVQEAEDHFKRTSLAPNPHPEEGSPKEEETETPEEEKTEDDQTKETADANAKADDDGLKVNPTENPEADATGPAGEVAAQLNPEEQAGQPSHPALGEEPVVEKK